MVSRRGTMRQQRQNKKSSGGAAPKISSVSTDSSNNRPKNHLITDATSPYTFTFTKFGKTKTVTVDQTPEEATWPGGALWDVGVLMARILVMATSPPPPPTSRETYIPRLTAPGVWGPTSWKERRVLELGCGVGLTGLVAGAVGARAVLLTDLDVVVDKVTIPNVGRNSHLGGNGGSKMSAKPLCWGNADDEAAASKELDQLAPPLLPHNAKESSSGRKKKKSKAKQKNAAAAAAAAAPPSNPMEGLSLSSSASRQGMPDILLIGDVAYQHKPGASSHFDILMSTVLHFTDAHTIVMFGTRMRMPASMDLLDMFRQHFDEIVEPPIEAHEIDGSFASESLGRKHNISVHIMRRKSTVDS